MDVDPWDEAVRLSQLPKARAIEALGRRIARLPLGTWQVSDTTDIAARLVALLPKHDPGVRPNPPDARTGTSTKPSAKLFLWLVAAGLAVSLLFGVPARIERLLTGDGIAAPVLTPSVQR